MIDAAPQRIAFVGLAFGAKVVERLVASQDRSRFTLAAVCDCDEARSLATATRHGVPACASLPELLGDDTIAAIGLFTAPAGRADLIRQIIRAGKDVMTTKPFELDPLAARDVLEEARRLGRTVFLNAPPPELPGYLQQIRRWQQEFGLGRPISCRGEMLASYREQADGRWFDDPARCPAAPLLRIGIYALVDLLPLFGRVREVQVQATRIFTQRPTPDNAQLGLVFENDAIGSIHASFCVDDGQPYANALVLHFERGTIHRNVAPVAPVAPGQAEHSSRLQLIATAPDGRGIRETWESPEASGSYPWEAFYDAITGRRHVPMPIADIVHAVEVTAAMARAENSGATERVVATGSPAPAPPAASALRR